MAKTLDAKSLRALISDIYCSEGGQSDLAVALGVDPRTVRRWLSGASNISLVHWAKIAEICEDRGLHAESWSRRILHELNNSKTKV